jgi:hypothetical protein
MTAMPTGLGVRQVGGLSGEHREPSSTEEETLTVGTGPREDRTQGREDEQVAFSNGFFDPP